MKLLKLLILVVIIGLVTYGFQTGFLNNLYNGALKSVKKSLSNNPSQVIQTEKVDDLPVSLPGPLLKLSNPFNADKKNDTVSITADGIITATNMARTQNGGLPVLTQNEILNASAMAKLDDLFKYQYFEHTSPSGVVLSDIVEGVGYEYVVIGENLALGDFRSSQEFVDEWMKSPGHRANILNARYEEIGVAVKRGLYHGNTVWIGVQHFAKPLSSCPLVDRELKKKVEALEVSIEVKRKELDTKKGEVEATPSYSPNYDQKVDEYNALAGEFNSLLKDLERTISRYNTQVRNFNTCVKGK